MQQANAKWHACDVSCVISESLMYKHVSRHKSFVAWTLLESVLRHQCSSVSLEERRLRLVLGRPFGVSLMTLLLRLVEVVAPPASSFTAASLFEVGWPASSPSGLSTPSASPSTPVTGKSQLFFQLRQSISVCEVGCPVDIPFACDSI